MVTLYNADGEAIRTFKQVISFARDYVLFDNNGYPGKIYADIEAGEYIDDPDSPLVPDPEDQRSDGT